MTLSSGVNLDLTSADRNITLGSNLFKDGASVEIQVGGETKTLSAGDKVTAAEYVAAKQVLAGVNQGVTVSGDGSATGGQVDLSAITSAGDKMRASDLTVPVNVTTLGDFSKGSDFKLLGNLNNYGTVHTFDADNNGKGGAVRADDILNAQGASITSDVDLTLQANGSLTNLGSISSNGNLTLNAATINNSGKVSAAQNITLDSSNDGGAAALTVNNSGAFVAGGDINVRASDYSGSANTVLNGGDYLSQNLNLNAGQGTIDAVIGNVTGNVNSAGYAVHFGSKAETLNLGKTALVDPTFFNFGDINITSDLTTNGEALTIIATGNITDSVGAGFTIATNGGAVTTGGVLTLIAGANITSINPNTPDPTLPSANPGSIVTFNGGSIGGGNIVLTDVDIVTSGTTDGGNVSMMAFGGTVNNGNIQVDQGSTITTFGSGAGVNGDVVVFGRGNLDFNTCNIDTNSISTIGGDVSFITAQPVSTGPVTYNADGTLGSGILLPDFNNVSTGSIDIDNINAAGDIFVTAGNDVNVDNLTSNGSFGIDLRAGINLAGNVVDPNGDMDLGGTIIANGTGSVFLRTSDNLDQNNNQNVTAGGDIRIEVGFNNPAAPAGADYNQSGFLNAGGRIDVLVGNDYNIAGTTDVVVANTGVSIATGTSTPGGSFTSNAPITAGGGLLDGDVTIVAQGAGNISFTNALADVNAGQGDPNFSGIVFISGGNVSSVANATITGRDVEIVADSTNGGDLDLAGAVTANNTLVPSTLRLTQIGTQTVNISDDDITGGISADRMIFTNNAPNGDVIFLNNATPINFQEVTVAATGSVTLIEPFGGIRDGNITFFGLNSAANNFTVTVDGNITGNLATLTGTNGFLTSNGVAPSGGNIGTNSANPLVVDFDNASLRALGAPSATVGNIFVADIDDLNLSGAASQATASVELTTFGNLTSNAGTFLLSPQIKLTSGGNIGTNGLSRFNVSNLGFTPSPNLANFSANATGDVFLNAPVGLRFVGASSAGGTFDVFSSDVNGELITDNNNGGIVSAVNVVLTSTNSNILGIGPGGSFTIDADTGKFVAGNSIIVRDVDDLTVDSANGPSSAPNIQIISDDVLNLVGGAGTVAVSGADVSLNSNKVSGDAIVIGADVTASNRVNVIGGGNIVTQGGAEVETTGGLDEVRLRSDNGNIGSDPFIPGGSTFNTDTAFIDLSAPNFGAPNGSIFVANARSVTLAAQPNISAGGILHVQSAQDLTTTAVINNLSQVRLLAGANGVLTVGANVTATTSILVSAGELTDANFTGAVLSAPRLDFRATGDTGVSPGTGTIVLTQATADFNVASFIATGAVTVTDNNGLTVADSASGTIFAGDFTINANQTLAGTLQTTGTITTGNGSNVVLNAASGSLIVGDDIADTVSSAGDVSLLATTTVTLNSDVTAVDDVSIVSAGTLTQSAGKISGDQLNVQFLTGPATLTTNINSITATAAGQVLNILEDSGITIGLLTLDTLVLDASLASGGDVNFSVAQTIGTLDIGNLDGNIDVNFDTGGSTLVNLQTGGAFTISTSSGSVITTPNLTLTAGAGGIDVDFGNGATAGQVTAQATGGDVALDHVGTGAVTLNGSTGNVNYTVTDSGTGIIIGGNIDGSGALDITTNSLTNANTLNFDTIDVQSNAASGLTIDTLTGGTFTAANGINFLATANNLLIDGAGTSTYNGNTTWEAQTAATTSVTVSAGQTINVNGNLTLNTCVYIQNGTVNVTGTTTQNCPFAAGTLISTTGDVTFGGDFIFNGQNFAVIAFGDINGGAANNINISGLNGGNFFAFAGVTATPAVVGQVFDSITNFTLGAASSTGGDINLGSVAINTSGTAGSGGSVRAYAFSDAGDTTGFISLGAINTSGTTTGGSVDVIGPNAIVVGAVNTQGGTGASGDVSIQTADPNVTSPLTVLNGTVSGGPVTAINNSNQSITFGNITAGDGDVLLFGDLSVPSGTVSGNVVDLRSTGSIGTDASTRVLVNAAQLQGSAGTDAFVTNQNVAASNLAAFTAGDELDLIFNGDTTVTGAQTGDDINISVQGVLSATANLTATTQLTLRSTQDLLTANIGANLLSAPVLQLTTLGGADIGVNGGAAFDVGANVGEIRVSALAGGTANVHSLDTTGVAFGTSTTTGNLFFSADGSATVVGNLTNADGDISIQIDSGVLNITNNVTINANSASGNGNIFLINDGTQKKVDQIILSDGADLTALAATKPGGNVTIQLGGPFDPNKIRDLASPRNVTFNKLNGGLIRGGKGGKPFVADNAGGNTNVVNADNANVLITNNNNKKDIILSGNNTITADPPVAPGTIADVTAAAISSKSSASPLMNFAPEASNGTAQPVNLLNLDNAVAIDYSAVNSSLVNLATASQTTPALAMMDDDNSYMVTSRPVGLEVDAKVCTDMQQLRLAGGAIGGNAGTGAQMIEHSACVTLNQGSVLFVPTTDTTVVTPKGTVKVAADSVALVMVDDNHLSVYDINDSHKRSVTVDAGGRSIALSPGRHLVVTHDQVGQFSDINPIDALMHRSVVRHELGNGKSAFASEFSMPSAMQVMKPLKAMLKAENAEAKKVADKMLKTSAVIMQIGGGAAYQYHAKPRTVALKW
ncbi:MAG: hypothetical protein K2X93_24195 [Candidatus Obscuribacterales bacterium]|nr:hypothetical protein [Candidatus Obscuribacterales bacterium]